MPIVKPGQAYADWVRLRALGLAPLVSRTRPSPSVPLSFSNCREDVQRRSKVRPYSNLGTVHFEEFVLAEPLN